MNRVLDIRNPILINRIGIEVLIRELGRIGAINFIQQYDRGNGDYTKERSQYFDNMSVDDICADIKKEIGG